MRHKLLLCVCFSFLLLGCDKEDEEPELPTSVVKVTLSPNSTSTKTGEIIIAEQGGKTLLDTVVATLQEHSFSLKTQEKEFVVTTVYAQPVTDQHFVDTYLQVNPNNWIMKQGTTFRFNSTTYPSSQPARVTYTNVPTIPAGGFHIANSFGSSSMGTAYNHLARTLDVDYQQHLSNYIYLILPSRSLYKLVKTQDKQVTIDLTKMDQATKVKFQVSANFRPLVTNVFGYPEANDYNNFLWVYYSFAPSLQGDFDAIYPAEGFANYRLNTFWSEGANLHEYYSMADTIPTRLPFFQESNLTLINQSFDNLQLQFNRMAPTYYSTTWASRDNKVIWNVYAPPTKTSYNPRTIIQNLSSSELRNRDLSDFSLTTLTFEGTDAPGYQNFFDLVFTSKPGSDGNMIRVSNKFTKRIR